MSQVTNQNELLDRLMQVLDEPKRYIVGVDEETSTVLWHCGTKNQYGVSFYNEDEEGGFLLSDPISIFQGRL